MKNNPLIAPTISLADYKIALTPESIIYKPKSVSAEQELGPYDKCTPIQDNTPGKTLDVAPLKSKKTITVSYSDKFKRSKHNSTNLHAEELNEPEYITTANPNFEKDFSSLKVPNQDQKSIQVTAQLFPESDAISSAKSCHFGRRYLSIENEIQITGRVYDNYLNIKNEHKVSLLKGGSDPVLLHTKDGQLKKDLERRSSHGKTDDLLKRYIAEYEKLCLAGAIPSPLENEEARTTYINLQMMKSLPGYIEKNEIISEEIEWVNKSPRTSVSFPAELETEYGVPLHAAYLRELRKMFPNTQFKLYSIDIPNQVFPGYIISFHLNDESNDGLGRDVKIQISDQKGASSYIDSELVRNVELPLPSEEKDLRKILTTSVIPVTKEIKQDYCDLMLCLATKDRDIDAVTRFLDLGGNPNRSMLFEYGVEFLGCLYSVNADEGLVPPLERESTVAQLLDGLQKTSLEVYAFTHTVFKPRQKGEKVTIEPAIFTACSKFFSFRENDGCKIKDTDLEIVELLINRGADINKIHRLSRIRKAMPQGINAIVLAISEYNEPLAKLLVKHGVDRDIKYTLGNGKTTMFPYVMHNGETIVSPLELAVEFELRKYLQLTSTGKSHYLNALSTDENTFIKYVKRHFPISSAIAGEDSAEFLDAIRTSFNLL